jgi:hypothetical protein
MPLPELLRYVVTELTGFLGDGRGSGPPGLSCHVVDTRLNRRVVATFRSEDEHRRQGSLGMRTEARRKAHERAARLNG